MKLIMTLTLFISFSAVADIDHSSNINIEPKAERVEASRACFNELRRQGCGHPKDDVEEFRSCMNEIFENLDSGCQKIMKRLYGN